VTRVAALYDIHANLPALEAVLEDVRQAEVDRIVVGGDVVPGPMPRETLRRLLTLDVPVQFIQGNGEVAVLAERSGRHSGVPEQFRDVVRWGGLQLDPEDEALIASWPKTLSLPIDELGPVLFCHATPRSDTEVFTRLTAEARLRPIFDPVDAGVVVCGHSHMQFDRTVGRVRVVNAGSVGMPFCAPGAYWLLLDGDIQLRRTDYDLVDAADRIRRTPYPQAAEFAERNVLHPPTEQSMLDAFSGIELT
jgi:predicted phosphodiesterase